MNTISVINELSEVKPVRTDPMDKEEATFYLTQINKTGKEFYFLLVEFYQRKGYKALGYSNWEEFVKTQFGFSKKGAYNFMRSAAISLQLGEDEIIGRTQAAILSKLPSVEVRREVWRSAKSLTKNNPTASQLRLAVSKYEGSPQVCTDGYVYPACDVTAMDVTHYYALFYFNMHGKRGRLVISKKQIEKLLTLPASPDDILTQNVANRVCPECKKEFATVVSNKRFCSVSCKNAFHWRNKAAQDREQRKQLKEDTEQ